MCVEPTLTSYGQIMWEEPGLSGGSHRSEFSQLRGLGLKAHTLRGSLELLKVLRGT